MKQKKMLNEIADRLDKNQNDEISDKQKNFILCPTKLCICSDS